MNQTVKIGVTADTTQAQRAVEALKSGLTRMADAGRSSMASMSSAIGKVTDGLGKFNLAMGGVREAMNLAKQSLDIAVEVKQLEHLTKAIPTAALEKLRQASRGLIAEVDILRLAAKGLTGEFAISADQMALVLQASITLERQGRGLRTEIADKLVQALAKGGAGLDDLGINFKKTGDQAKDTAGILAEYQRLATDPAAENAELDRLQRAQVAWSNWGLAIKQAISEVVLALQWLADKTRDIDLEMDAWLRQTLGVTGRWKVVDQIRGQMQDAIARQHEAARAREMEEIHARDDLWNWMPKPLEEKKRARGRSAGPSDSVIDTADGFGNLGKFGDKLADVLDDVYKKARAEHEKALDAADAANRRGTQIGAEQDAEWDREFREQESTRSKDAALEEWQGKFDMAKALGFDGAPLDSTTESLMRMTEVMSALGDQTHVVGAAFGALKSGVVAAVDAAISGEEGMGKAAAKAAAASLKATAIQATVEALYYTARGIAGLATGNPQAIGFFAAAGKMAATAAAAGAGAAALGSLAGGGGGSSGGGGGGGAGGGFASAPSSGGGSGGSTIVINIGDGFVGEPHRLAEELEKKLRGGRRAGRVRDGDGPVRFA